MKLMNHFKRVVCCGIIYSLALPLLVPYVLAEETSIIPESSQNTESLLNLQSAFGLQAAPTNEATSNPILKSNPFAQLKGLGGKLDVSFFDGALNYQYPINIPAGVRGLTPNVGLNYSSQRRNLNSRSGYGWDIGLQSISRFSERGLDKIYEREDFRSRFSGGGGELLRLDTDGRFGLKDEAGFVDYHFQNNTWVARTTDGTKYTFGSNSATRQYNPENPNEIYQWMLEKVEDLHGNSIAYRYFKDGGEIYLDTITYGGIYKIDYIWENRNPVDSYETGFKVITQKRLNKIELGLTDACENNCQAGTFLTYNFSYDYANRSITRLKNMALA